MIPDLGSGVQMYSVFDGHGENGGMVSQWSIANLPSYMAQAVQEGRAGELLNKATDAYRAADIFCLPSYAEGLPMGVLEAMGAGLPVVSTAINGTPDAVLDGTTGFLHEPGDRRTLARLLITLLKSHTLRLQQGRAGYERVTAEFDPESQSQRLRDMWTEVLQGHR